MSNLNIPTRSDDSLSSLKAITACFLKAGVQAFSTIRSQIGDESSRFRYIGDFLVREAIFYKYFADYHLYHKSVPEPATQQGPFIVLVSADTLSWHYEDEELESYLGYTLAELENDWVVAYHPDTYEETDAELISIFRGLYDGTKSFSETDVRYQTKSGYSVWSHLTFSLVKDWRGVPEYYLMTIRDATLINWTEILYKELSALVELTELLGLYDESIYTIEGLLRHYDGEIVDQQLMLKIRDLLRAR